MNAEPQTRRDYSPSNPFASRIRARLRAAGGQYRSPGTDTDARIQRDELACSMLRESYELSAGPEPAPF